MIGSVQTELRGLSTGVVRAARSRASRGGLEHGGGISDRVCDAVNFGSCDGRRARPEVSCGAPERPADADGGHLAGTGERSALPRRDAQERVISAARNSGGLARGTRGELSVELRLVLAIGLTPESAGSRWRIPSMGFREKRCLANVCPPRGVCVRRSSGQPGHLDGSCRRNHASAPAGIRRRAKFAMMSDMLRLDQCAPAARQRAHAVRGIRRPESASKPKLGLGGGW